MSECACINKLSCDHHNRVSRLATNTSIISRNIITGRSRMLCFDKVGVMLVPGGGCFGGGIDFGGYVRIGYVQEPQALLNGLQALREFMRNEYEKLPAA
jgi:hypothetical protein